MEMSPNTLAQQRQARMVATVLFGSGLLFLAAGLAIGLLVHPAGFIAVVIGAIDLLLARHFLPERSGTILPPDPGAHADPDLIASDAEPDATSNPYARED
jgi:uncharacterized membrane protein